MCFYFFHVEIIDFNGSLNCISSKNISGMKIADVAEIYQTHSSINNGCQIIKF